ncbi:MAG: imidazolonepropionase, partial [Phaeodactylibacter sp.]|nr:imidazolonepropionase [Phaeodactylibacter sp.]
MATLRIDNIAFLIQAGSGSGDKRKGAAMQQLPVLQQAYLLIEDGRIRDMGTMQPELPRADRVLDAHGGAVLPCWVDSHTHLVFAGSREQEFEDRLRGLSYEAIAQRGGGILNSAKRLRTATEDELYDAALQRLEEVMRLGTGGIEIKSGYGLSLESELKILRVIRRLKAVAPIPIKATFLGAHAVPPEYKQDRAGYLKLVTGDLLERVVREKLADYVDVFCEKVAFSVAETKQVLEAGAKHGLKAKIHVNQFHAMGGIELA